MTTSRYARFFHLEGQLFFRPAPLVGDRELATGDRVYFGNGLPAEVGEETTVDGQRVFHGTALDLDAVGREERATAAHLRTLSSQEVIAWLDQNPYRTWFWRHIERALTDVALAAFRQGDAATARQIVERLEPGEDRGMLLMAIREAENGTSLGQWMAHT